MIAFLVEIKVVCVCIHTGHVDMSLHDIGHWVCAPAWLGTLGVPCIALTFMSDVMHVMQLSAVMVDRMLLYTVHRKYSVVALVEV